jgi:hypothetical protein
MTKVSQKYGDPRDNDNKMTILRVGSGLGLVLENLRVWMAGIRVTG